MIDWLSVRPLFVGEAPARGSGGTPFKCASGDRMRRIEPNFDSWFELTNLLKVPQVKSGKGDLFQFPEAIDAATMLLAQADGRPLVLAGKRVAKAFGVKVGYFEWTKVGESEVVVIPHPSGINRWWNRDGAMLVVGKVLHEAIVKAVALQQQWRERCRDGSTRQKSS